jgi:hypothetical protein
MDASPVPLAAEPVKAPVEQPKPEPESV